MKLSPVFTTATPLSKALALIIFICLPFVGAYFGYKFGQYSSIVTETNCDTHSTKIIPPPNWLELNQNDQKLWHLTFYYPPTADAGTISQAFSMDIVNINNTYINSELKEGWTILVDRYQDDINQKTITDFYAKSIKSGNTISAIKYIDIDGHSQPYYEISNTNQPKEIEYFISRPNSNQVFLFHAYYVGTNEIQYLDTIKSIVATVKFI